VVIADEALQAAIELSMLFLPEQALPEKAIDLMDETAAACGYHPMTALQELEELTTMELNRKKTSRCRTRLRQRGRVPRSM